MSRFNFGLEDWSNKDDDALPYVHEDGQVATPKHHTQPTYSAPLYTLEMVENTEQRAYILGYTDAEKEFNSDSKMHMTFVCAIWGSITFLIGVCVGYYSH